MTRICDVNGCERAHLALGLCRMHYKRWLWTGARNPAGYGVVGAGRRGDGVKLAHRMSYEVFVGPIPDGLHLDHLCVRPACIRPEHLEAVTQQENNRREHERQKEMAA